MRKKKLKNRIKYLELMDAVNETIIHIQESQIKQLEREKKEKK